METSSRRFLWILACMACLLVGFGIYLIQRDLQVLVSQRTHSLEQSLFAANALLPYELVELSLNSKDSKSFEREELQRALQNLMTELRLNGKLSVGLVEQGEFRVVVSSDTQWDAGYLFELGEDSNRLLREGRHYSSDFIKLEGAHFLYSVIPLNDIENGALLYVANESGLYYQAAGLILHYALLFLGLLFLCGLGIYAIYTSSRKRLKDFQQRTSTYFQEGNQLALAIDFQGRFKELNWRALEAFGKTWEDLAEKNWSEIAAFIPLEISWSDVLHKLQQKQSFQFRLKYLKPSDEIRYFKVKVFPQTSEALVLLDDITGKAMLKMEDSSFYDPVTKLPNAHYFRSIMETQRERFTMTKNSMLLVEVYQLEAPDVFASLLKEYFRQTDMLISYQANLFMVLLSGTDLERAYLIAQNLPRQISENTDVRIKSISINVGVAQLDKDESYSEWVARAEAALLTAKQFGKNRIEAQKIDALEILENPTTSMPA